MKIVHFLKSASLGISTVFVLLNENPNDFFQKVAQRFKCVRGAQKLFGLLSFEGILEGNETEAERMERLGHLSKARTLAENSTRKSFRDSRLIRRVSERLDTLEQQPAPGKQLGWSTSTPRVLHVLTNSQPHTASGYTVRSHSILKAQKSAGIEAFVATRLGYPMVVGRIAASAVENVEGITYFRLLPWLLPTSAKKRRKCYIKLIVRYARDIHATMLHTTTDYNNALAVSEAARILDIPWVYEVRGELEATWLSRLADEDQADAATSEYFRKSRELETRCMDAASAVVALSEISRNLIVQRGISAEKVTVVPNAVDEALIGKIYDKRSLRKELGLPEDKILIGTVTAVVAYEGLETLIEALASLPEQYSALIVGDGTELPRLIELAESLNLRERAIFAGQQPSDGIWRWYGALDVFVVPRRDTRVTRTVTPIKPLLALALGLPVVASDLPALREVTAETGNYVTAGDSSEFAKAIKSSLRSPSANLVSTEVVTWLKKRTWKANAETYSSLYKG